jgi:hypothetical protein
MIEAKNLFQIFHCSELDQNEFEQVVTSYFGHGYYAPPEMHHGRKDRNCALRTIYNKTGKLIEVRGGPDLCAGDIEGLRHRIESELLTEVATKVRSSVLFSPVPTVGYLRYRDVFQIVPVPADAPRPRFPIIEDHPFLLELKVRSSSNFVITSVRHQRKARQLELLLSSLFDVRVWSIRPEKRSYWVMDISEGALVLPSKFLQEGYSWHGAVAELDDFSPTQQLSPVEQINPQEYYPFRAVSVDSALSAPSDIEQQLDKFFSLPMEQREKFLRASYWFQYARAVLRDSKSASFVALVSAIEALMPPAKERCSHCNQIVGVTKRFAHFVESTIPGGDAVPVAERKRFYGLRSELSHGETLLSVDNDAWSFTPTQLKEGYDSDTVRKIVQLVLHYWLAAL